MSKRIWPAFLLLGLWALGLGAFLIFKPERITLVTDEWCPFNCQPDSARPGFMVEMAQQIFAKHNIKVDYKLQPWSEAISAVRTGKYDGLIGASRSDAPDFVFHKAPAAQMFTSFYTLPSTNWRYANQESLRRIRLGVIRNYTYGDPLDSYIKVQPATSPQLVVSDGDNALNDNFQMLLEGKIDAIAEEESVMQYKLSQRNLASRIIRAGDLGRNSATNLYIAFSPANINARRYAAILDQEIPVMRARGELKAIYDRYMSDDLSTFSSH